MNEPKQQLAMLPQPEMLNPIQLLQVAVQRGVDTEQLKALMELQREWNPSKRAKRFTRR